MRKTAALAIALSLPAALMVPAAAMSPSQSPAAARSHRPAPTHSARLPGTTCQVFPKDNYWHADIRSLKVDKHSSAWLSHMSTAGRNLHPDFGPSFGDGPVPYGIPVTIVHGGPKVAVKFQYASESDRVRYPLSSATKIEGGSQATGDRHAVVVDASTCTLYETFDTRLTAHGWTAGSGAVWSLRSNRLRPRGWTSADAAGLPILPGLLRYDEVKAGRVDHAIRFTTNLTSTKFIWPARHQAGSMPGSSYPPMGARFRLKKSFSTKGFSRDAKVVIKAMKRYGLVLADNGSPWYFQGTSDPRWTARFVDQLKRIPASAFQAVDTSSLRIRSGSAKARAR